MRKRKTRISEAQDREIVALGFERRPSRSRPILYLHRTFPRIAIGSWSGDHWSVECGHRGGCGGDFEAAIRSARALITACEADPDPETRLLIDYGYRVQTRQEFERACRFDSGLIDRAQELSGNIVLWDPYDDDAGPDQVFLLVGDDPSELAATAVRMLRYDVNARHPAELKEEDDEVPPGLLPDSGSAESLK